PFKASIPIIAMTANAFDEDREEAINAGMNGYVPKPLDVKKMMETLKEHLFK
ncbi:MAG: response regulator, partial [Desulfovibrio sp.]|nr:response regulator [Desulfovibrio sp.]